MAAYLSTLRTGAMLTYLALSSSALAQELGSRHEWSFEVEAGYGGASSIYDAWTDGGLGKLRYDEDDQGFIANRVFAHYRGYLTPVLWANVVMDYVNDGSGGLGVSEAYLEWHPVPRSQNRNRWKLGAFYPPLSLENTEAGWSSPYSISYSAVNTWLGEEIKPFALEWSLSRPVGYSGSPHEFGAFAAAFYGNDAAGALLFWRGWSLHDRQTRLNDRLRVPQSPVWDGGGDIVGFRDQYVEPFDEIDHEPGYYAGVEWKYARQALVQLSHYDNRADPEAFSDGQWGWRTTFSQAAFQVSLPWRLGVIGQWMRGETDWLVGVAPNGLIPSFATLERDAFESAYLLLTHALDDAHRLSIRYDKFDIIREESPPALRSDHGDAWTLAYRYERLPRFVVAVEWMQIDSTRDLWSAFYGSPPQATERQLRARITLKLGKQ